MDCRQTLCAAALLVSAAAGCTPNKLMPVWPGADSPPTVGRPVRTPGEPEEYQPVKELKPKTLVAMAHFREQMAAEVAKTPAQREFLMEEARTAFLRALKEDPNYLPAHIGLARHWEANGQHERAMTSYEAALKLAPKDAGLCYEVGMVQARHKEWKPALERLQQATASDPENRQLASSYALALARAERFDESLVCLRKLYPDKEAEAQYNLARMLHHMEKDDLSRQHATLAVQADPNFEPAQELLASLNAVPTAQAP
ncbi:MAG: tetratricopeptide repeat protein [Planctomycetia bacterium]|nr:tetratricopeptide repeat protein [Planctomycetia bacterium]